jgi:hypothetical protein
VSEFLLSVGNNDIRDRFERTYRSVRTEHARCPGPNGLILSRATTPGPVLIVSRSRAQREVDQSVRHLCLQEGEPRSTTTSGDAWAHLASCKNRWHDALPARSKDRGAGGSNRGGTIYIPLVVQNRSLACQEALRAASYTTHKQKHPQKQGDGTGVNANSQMTYFAKLKLTHPQCQLRIAPPSQDLV